MVHISEISDAYVESVQDYVQKDEVVKVRVMSVKDGKSDFPYVKRARRKRSSLANPAKQNRNQNPRNAKRI